MPAKRKTAAKKPAAKKPAAKPAPAPKKKVDYTGSLPLSCPRHPNH